MYAKYILYLEDEYNESNKIKDTTNPDWKHKKMFKYCPATEAVSTFG